MSTSITNTASRGQYWFSLLTQNAKQREGQCASVKAADGDIDGQPARIIAVVPDARIITRERLTVKLVC